MSFLAAIEVDRRQQVIAATDKLKEILGGSWNIEDTVNFFQELSIPPAATRLLQPVSGAVWLTSTDEAELRNVVWQFRQKLVETLELPCTFAIVEYQDLDAGVRAANLQIEARKDKDQGDGRPFSPLFASCQIQPSYPATCWKPKRELPSDSQDEDEDGRPARAPRSRQRHQRSAIRHRLLHARTLPRSLPGVQIRQIQETLAIRQSGCRQKRSVSRPHPR